MQKHLSIYFVISFRFSLYIDVRAAVHHGRLSRSVHMNRFAIEISLVSITIIAGINAIKCMHMVIEDMNEEGFDADEVEEELIDLGCTLDYSFTLLAWGESYGDA